MENEELTTPQTFMDDPTIVINGVPIASLILGGDPVYPEIPEDGSSDWSNVWPTSQIAMFRSVKMTDGEMWQVMMTQANIEGDYTISVGNPDTGIAKAFQIAAAFLNIPLWWVGTPPPPPIDQAPPEIEGDEGGGSAPPPPHHPR